MKKLMFVAFVVATMFAAKSGAQAYVDGGLNCSSTSLVICAKLDQAGGTVLATNGERGDYVRMACPQGFGPQCIPVTDAERLCRERGPRFFWNRRNHCLYNEPQEGGGSGGSGSGSTDNGGSTIIGGSGVAVAVPRCTDVDRGRLAQELDRIQAAVEVVEELHPLQERAAEVYGTLVACDDGTPESRALIQRAADMVATFEPDPFLPPQIVIPPPPGPVVITVPEEENFCTDSFGGVLTCIVLPVVAAGAAIFLGVYYGTEWSATQE